MTTTNDTSHMPAPQPAVQACACGATTLFGRGMCSHCYSQARYRGQILGTWTTDRRDPSTAREHLARLKAAKIPAHQVAKMAGISHTVLSRLGKSKFITSHNEDAILSVPVPEDATAVVADNSLIPAFGAIRRIQALIADGHPQVDLARELGIDVANLRLLTGRPVIGPHSTGESITAARHRAVVELFERRQMTPGTSQRSRNLAARMGWARSFEWDEEALDDPNGRPTRSQWTPTSARDERRAQREARAERVHELTRQGRTAQHIADELGISTRHVQRIQAAQTSTSTAHPTHKEETSMSDTTRPDLDALDNAAHRLLVDQLEATELQRIDSFFTELAEGAGHEEVAATMTAPGQRMAFLFATVASNQARDRREQQGLAEEDAKGQGPEAVTRMAQDLEEARIAAEEQLSAASAQLGPASVAPLAQALFWRGDSEVAADRLVEFITAYEEGWGVMIDPEQFAVSVDPDFDATLVQDYLTAARVHDRQSAVIDTVSAMALPDTAKAAVTEAISRWRGELDPTDPHAWLDGKDDRRAQLGRDLDAARLAPPDRVRVEFAVGYLSDDLGEMDLLTAPATVDPGEEVRSRVPELMDAFERGARPRSIAEEIAVMSAGDQAAVRAVGAAIKAGKKVDYQVFPGYIARESLDERLDTHAVNAEELQDIADYLPEAIAQQVDNPELWGLSDDTADYITQLATEHEQLLAIARDAQGLTSMERAHLDAVVRDVAAGRIQGRAALPEVMWTDERTLAAVDAQRQGKRAAEISTTVRDRIAELAGPDAMDQHTREGQNLKAQVGWLADRLYMVACGSSGGRDLASNREKFAAERTAVGKALTATGVPDPAKDQIRALIDGQAREAGQRGKLAIQRQQQWRGRTEQLVRSRDDRIAQRRAVATGRPPAGTSRECAAKSEPSAPAPGSPGRAIAGRRQLHAQEVCR